MTPIRPAILPPGAAPAQPQRLDEGKLAAQRAFFQAALGQAPAAAPAATAPAAPPPAAPVRAAPEMPAEPPQKVLRPGSILDIRV